MIFVTQICQLMEAHVLCTKMFNSLLLLPYLLSFLLPTILLISTTLTKLQNAHSAPVTSCFYVVFPFH